MATKVSATKEELLRIKAEIKLAKQGKEILEKKKQTLLKRFLEMVRVYQQHREVLLGTLKGGADALRLTKARDGSVAVKSIALATRRDIELEISKDNLMGTPIFEVGSQTLTRDLLSRGYNPANVSVRIDRVARAFESLLEDLLKIVHLEHNLKRIGEEIRRLNRKINSLEENTIPDLEAQQKYIEDTLAQLTRENIYRLKMVKRIIRADSR
ncbi:MAG: V-type ATP synthase subunit D [Candidatus Bipolaricaulia bacterium]